MTPQEARTQLRDLMLTISESHWCAGWHCNLEYILWEAVAKGPEHDHESELPVPRLRYLAEQAGGWWAWPDDEDDKCFVTMSAWLQMYESHRKAAR